MTQATLGEYGIETPLADEVVENLSILASELKESGSYLLNATQRIRGQQETLNRIESKIDTIMHGIIPERRSCKKCGEII